MVNTYRILTGDAIEQLRTLPDASVHCVVTSPPYWGLRSYLPDGVQLRSDAPDWVIEELEKRGIFPLAHITDL